MYPRRIEIGRKQRLVPSQAAALDAACRSAWYNAGSKRTTAAGPLHVLRILEEAASSRRRPGPARRRSFRRGRSAANSSKQSPAAPAAGTPGAAQPREKREHMRPVIPEERGGRVLEAGISFPTRPAAESRRSLLESTPRAIGARRAAGSAGYRGYGRQGDSRCRFPGIHTSPCASADRLQDRNASQIPSGSPSDAPNSGKGPSDIPRR